MLSQVQILKILDNDLAELKSVLEEPQIGDQNSNHSIEQQRLMATNLRNELIKLKKLAHSTPYLWQLIGRNIQQMEIAYKETFTPHPSPQAKSSQDLILHDVIVRSSKVLVALMESLLSVFEKANDKKQPTTIATTATTTTTTTNNPRPLKGILKSKSSPQIETSYNERTQEKCESTEEKNLYNANQENQIRLEFQLQKLRQTKEKLFKNKEVNEEDSSSENISGNERLQATRHLGLFLEDLKTNFLEFELKPIVGKKLSDFLRVYRLLLRQDIPRTNNDLQLLHEYIHRPDAFDNGLAQFFKTRLQLTSSIYERNVIETDCELTRRLLAQRRWQLRLMRLPSFLRLSDEAQLMLIASDSKLLEHMTSELANSDSSNIELRRKNSRILLEQAINVPHSQ